MRILMMTNTFLPHVGGVARSVDFFSKALTKLGHEILVIAPVFKGQPEHEENVIRIPALRNFSGGDFSVVPPIALIPWKRIDRFAPDVIHSHHPFLLGSWALRIATQQQSPLVFTHHTMYEQYTHYVPGDSPQLKQFVIELVTGYCNLCNHIVSPSESVAEILRQRGVVKPITSIPTGVHIEEFENGNGDRARQRYGIPQGAFVLGHLGRLAPEKNLEFLTRSALPFLESNPETHFLVIGSGPSRESIERLCRENRLSERLHMPGVLQGRELVDAYHAMDLFAFASKSETQGMVLVEAQAAGTPVVALDAPGAREIVQDRQNGRLVREESAEQFTRALEWVHDQPRKKDLRDHSLKTAREFSMTRCAQRCAELYEKVATEAPFSEPGEDSAWHRALALVQTEWELLSNTANSAASLLERKTETPD